MDLPSLLEKIVQRIVAECRPAKIILFGSHATGQGSPTSDLDLLVVAEGHVPKRQQAVALYRALRDIGMPKDIIVVRPDEFERYRDIVGTIIYPAAHGGRVLYDAQAA